MIASYFRFLLFILGITMAPGLSAQHTHIQGHCGVSTENLEEQVARILANRARFENAPELQARALETRYVPITFILTADDDGVGFPREETVLEQLAAINDAWDRYDYVFYIDEVKYVANSFIYNGPSTAAGEFQMNKVRDGNALNVYVTENATSGNTPPEGSITLAYYSNANDWIVIRKDRFGGNSLIMPHEIGHFFSLQHTFWGWDCTAYDEEVHGNPVSSIWAPCISNWRVEFQDRTNCTNSGDMICDTPPDYNFGSGWSVDGDQCAEFTDEVMDPRGVVVTPQQNNYMSYFFDCDEYTFTQGQLNVISGDYTSPNRSYLRTGIIPNTEVVTNDIDHIYPINDEVTDGFELVTLDWENVPGAEQYLVAISRLPNFNQPEKFTVSESQVDVEGLEFDRRYYWRVWPYNETSTGAGYGDTQQFITGISTSTREILGLEDFSVYPNPVTGGRFILSISANETLHLDIWMYDISGKLVAGDPGHFIQAGSTYQIDLLTDEVPKGLYLVQLVSQNGVLSRKISVQ